MLCETILHTDALRCLFSSSNSPRCRLGDVPDPQTGLSPYPANINQLVMAMDSYTRVLQETAGVMEEFVNPKYTDPTKTKFKKPTRLECMMQGAQPRVRIVSRDGVRRCGACGLGS